MIIFTCKKAHLWNATFVFVSLGVFFLPFLGFLCLLSQPEIIQAIGMIIFVKTKLKNNFFLSILILLYNSFVFVYALILKKGLGRVIFTQSFVFEQKYAEKSHFSLDGSLSKIPNLIFWIVLSGLHTLRAKTLGVTAWYSKYYTSLNVPKKTSHFDSWKINFKTGLRSGNMFCIKFQVLLKVFSSFPCWNTAT